MDRPSPSSDNNSSNPIQTQGQTQSQTQSQTQNQNQNMQIAAQTANEYLLPYRARLVQRASQKIPYTAEGLPVGLYRVDLLPTTPVPALEEIECLKNAYIDLSFEHGYPTLPDSRPYWHKLDFEPSFAYGSFQIYLELINQGPREISLMYENLELRQLASRLKSLPPPEQITPQELGLLLNEYAILYSWRSRAKAHDLYKEASYRHLRLRRQMSVEENHYSIATKLLADLQEQVFDDPEFWEHMSGKTAVDLLSKLVAIQRVSVGLPAAGPLSQKEQPELTTFEMIMRSLGQKSGQIYENGGQTSNQQQSRELLNHVLRDKDAATNLQELVIRVTRATQNQQNQLPNPYEGRKAFKGRNYPHSPSKEIITDDIITGLDISGAPGENLDDADTDEPRKQ